MKRERCIALYELTAVVEEWRTSTLDSGWSGQLKETTDYCMCDALSIGNGADQRLDGGEKCAARAPVRQEEEV